MIFPRWSCRIDAEIRTWMVAGAPYESGAGAQQTGLTPGRNVGGPGVGYHALDAGGEPADGLYAASGPQAVEPDLYAALAMT